MSQDIQAVVGRKVVTPQGVRPAAVFLEGETIARLGDPAEATGPGVLDAGNLWILPGLVDTHVHVNEPGRTEWEGFATATRAAAAGGVTTLVDMPLNSVPATTSAAALAEKRRAARGSVWIDTGFWGGVVPGNTAELGAMVEAGVPGFKCFLVPSGVDEFPYVTEEHLRDAMPELAALDSLLLVHAEVPAPIEGAAAACASMDPRAYQTYLASRPPEAEVEAIALMVRLCRETGARVHIVHLPCADAVPVLQRARLEGLPITAETCPHYLFFHAGAIPDGATAHKCAPPIREHSHKEAMWQALEEGLLDMVVTDHSPCPPDLKRPSDGDFLQAWGGIASLQLGLSVVWTEARSRHIPLERVARWMAAAPARLARLAKKGRIAPGLDADLVLFDPDARWTVRGEALEHRHKITPYEGRELCGKVTTTILRGQVVFDGGAPCGEPRGRLLP